MISANMSLKALNDREVIAHGLCRASMSSVPQLTQASVLSAGWHNIGDVLNS